MAIEPVESVSREAILATLAGVQRAPGMYGGAESLEVLGFVLLSLLAGPGHREEVGKAFMTRVRLLEAQGLGYPETSKEMAQVLKEVQEELFPSNL